ncbi:reverse transcriptase N-terminal domain-containing protein, partial [Chloroflexota bacterium]
MTPALRPSEVWKSLPWKKYQRNVFRLQEARPSMDGTLSSQTTGRCQDCSQTYADTIHRWLLLRSRSARFLAVRRVSQDNRGKKTPGVDGVASLTPKQRLKYVRRLRNLDRAADPVRRTYLQKPDGSGKRPLGIPTMLQRAYQALIKLALEPE